MCKGILHNAHGEYINGATDACFANREPHIVLSFQATPLPPALPHSQEMEEFIAWADAIVTEISDRGLATDWRYLSFTRPEECGDTVRFFGEEGTQRLMALKKTFDGGNIFVQAYPNLA